MARYRFVVCDVFTATPLEGNQLAVFPDGPSIPEALLQSLAREMHFSETVFVYPPSSAQADFRIRIFTPTTELPFAGHPLLGTAFVLGATVADSLVRLEVGRGVIPIRLERDGAAIRFGWMRQPIPTVAPLPMADELLQILGVDRSLLPIEVYDNGVQHAFVVLMSERSVAELAPDFGALARVFPELGANCLAGAGTRWKTRFFGPGLGAAEDPATGSAAGPLAVHLARHGQIPFGTEIQISQGVELSRPSTLHARVAGQGDQIDRVEVGGSAVVVAEGSVTL